MEKMPKIWIEELLSGRLDRDSEKAAKAGKGKWGIWRQEKLGKMIGYIMPNDDGKTWEVALLSGGGMTVESQEMAEVIAQNETIIALLLKQKRQKKVR
jgi:hypothetical protein